MSSMVFRKLTADLAQDTACGGKARGLARLLAAGARVPPAYVLDAADPADAARVAAEVQLPELPAGSRWAVRSSALAEDGPARSYAGLFHTALDVPPHEVRAAIAACIASGASAQVLAYAGQPQPVGVLLQQQIQPRAAGVCFTRDPLGADRALLIEAVPGRGDALVSGHREPERWRVYVNGLGRAEWQREGPAVLRVEEALQLAEQARRLAAAFATPLDLEWAIGDAGVEWLQARPITTLREPVDLRVEASFPGADNGAVSVWSNFNVRETMPRPMSRLNMSLWTHSILPTVAEPVFGLPAESPLLREVLPVDFVQGRLYWNMNAFLALPMGRLLMRHALALLDPQAQQIVIQLMDTGILRARRLPGSRLLNTARLLAASTVAMLRMQRTPSPERMLVELQAMADALRSRPPLATLTPAALVAELSLVRECQPMIVASRLMSRAIATFGIADWLYRHAPDARALLTAGLSGNPTTAISLSLDELALAAQPLRAAFVDPAGWEARLAAVAALPGGREWCARFDEFLTHNGQRCPAEFDLTQPRWREDPTLPLELGRQAVLDAGHQSLADRLAALRERRTVAIDAALRASPAWKRPLMRALLRRLERIAPMREAPKHYGMHAFTRMRAAALEIGRRLCADGRLDEATQVFHLDLAELKAWARDPAAALPGRDDIAARLARWETDATMAPPDFWRSDGVPVRVPETAGGDGVWHGVPASGGVARGRVRVLATPDAAALRPGEVLVAELADPGWTPLFPRAAAIVMEVGGQMCHAAVVARELGIPAVFALRGARQLLTDGMQVEVDGSRGTVRLV
ncbi:MAG: hypothetical protein IPK27_20710 [Rhodanobacteraceae bacterium]|nr:hypothetical protein [Rhodanobacteraceae bacterium]